MSRMGNIKAAKPATKMEAAIATANNALGKMRVMAWAKASAPGEMLCYATGEGLSDDDVTFSPAVWAVRSLYNDGIVTLIQKRLTHQKRAVMKTKTRPGKPAVEGTFAYIAVKLAKPSKPEPSWSKEGSHRVDQFTMRDAA